MSPFRKVFDELVVWLLSDGSELETDGFVLENWSSRAGRRVDFLFLSEVFVRVVWFSGDDSGLASLDEQFWVILKGSGLSESGRFNESQTEVQDGEGWNERETLKNSPGSR